MTLLCKQCHILFLLTELLPVYVFFQSLLCFDAPRLLLWLNHTYVLASEVCLNVNLFFCCHVGLIPNLRQPIFCRNSNLCPDAALGPGVTAFMTAIQNRWTWIDMKVNGDRERNDALKESSVWISLRDSSFTRQLHCFLTWPTLVSST